jgi:hypothetical protein
VRDSDWDDEEEEPESSCFNPVTHRPQLLDSQCPTCIGRPGNLMRLNPGRVQEMVTGALQQGCQGIICHATLPYGENGEDPGPALCRWFYDTYGPRNNFIRVMERIGGFTQVSLPGEEQQ